MSPALAPKRSRESDVPVDAATLLGLLNKVASFPSFRTEILPKLAELMGMEQPEGPWSQPRFKVKDIPQRAQESGVRVGDRYTDEELRSVVPELEAIHQMPGIIALNPGTPGGDTPESRLKTVAYVNELSNQRRLREGRVTPEELSSQSSAVRPDPNPGKRAANAMVNMLYGTTPAEQSLEYIPGVGKAVKLFGRVGMRGIEQALLLVPLGARKRLRSFLTSSNAAMPLRESAMAGTGEQLGRTTGNKTIVSDWEAPGAMREFIQGYGKAGRERSVRFSEHVRRGGANTGSFITDLESLTPEGEQGEPIVQAIAWLKQRYPRIANHFREIQVQPGISLEGQAGHVMHPPTRSARTQFASGVERPAIDPITAHPAPKPEEILEGVEMYRRMHGLSSTEPYGLFRYASKRSALLDPNTGVPIGVGDPAYGSPPRSTAKPQPFLEMSLSDHTLVNPRWRELKRYLGTEDPMLRVASEPHLRMSGRRAPLVAEYPEQFATRHGGVRDPDYRSQASHRSGYRPHEVTQPVGWDDADKEKRVLAKHWGEPTVEDLPVEQRPFMRLDQYGRPIPHALEVAAISRQLSNVVHETTHGVQNIRRLGREDHIKLMRSSDPEDWTKVKREPTGYGKTTRDYQRSAVEQDPQIRGATAQLEYLASEYQRAQKIGGKDALDVQHAIKDELIEIFSGRTNSMMSGGGTIVEIALDKKSPLPRNILGTAGPNRNEEAFQFLKRLEESLRSRHKIDPESIGAPAGGLYNEVMKNLPDLGHRWVRENDTWKKVPYHAGMVKESVDRFIEAALSGNKKHLDKIVREEGYSVAKESQEFAIAMGDIFEGYEDYWKELMKHSRMGDLKRLPLGQGVSDIAEPHVRMPGWQSRKPRPTP